jgi:SAM-dependent methyltransferase
VQDSIYNFWRNHSLANIKPNVGGEYPEGWDVVEFFNKLYTEEDYGTVVEIGCGYGRLCRAFDTDIYKGLDISPEAIRMARKTYPNYKFDLMLNPDDMFPHSDTKLLYTVALYQTDEDIEWMIKRLCKTTSDRVIIAEVSGRDWRREGNPPVFNRSPEEYDFLFAQQDWGLGALIKKPYDRYKAWKKDDTNLSIMVFND